MKIELKLEEKTFLIGLLNYYKNTKLLLPPNYQTKESIKHMKLVKGILEELEK